MNRMKKALLVVAVWLTLSAAAEGVTPVGQAPNGDAILRYEAENGQALFFTAREGDTLPMRSDVNFDGHPDLVFLTARGAANFFYQFFLWSAGQYVYVLPPDESGLCNYELYPDRGIVKTYRNDGAAGLEFEETLYRWDGAQLVPVAKAYGASESEDTVAGGWYVRKVHTERVVWRVTRGESTLWERVVSAEQADDPALWADKDAALWAAAESE